MNTLRAFSALLILTVVTAAQQAGTHDRTLEIDGAKRRYLVHVPEGIDKQSKAPLVLMLHGRTSNRKQAASSYYGWKPMANKHKFVVAFPQALGRPTSWNPSWRNARPTSDAKFLERLIDLLVKEYGLDANRVFMTGHSSGGIMSFSFAATHSLKVAAIAPVAGTIGIERGGRAFKVPAPKTPVPVISFHGMKDKIVAYDKERGKGAAYVLISAPDSIAHFARAAGYEGKPERETRNDGNVHVDTWSAGTNQVRVVLYSIENAGHEWPSGRRNSVKATDLAWEFFSKHGRKAPAKAGKPAKK